LALLMELFNMGKVVPLSEVKLEIAFCDEYSIFCLFLAQLEQEQGGIGGSID
jgi:hypothetical protein